MYRCSGDHCFMDGSAFRFYEPRSEDAGDKYLVVRDDEKIIARPDSGDRRRGNYVNKIVDHFKLKLSIAAMKNKGSVQRWLARRNFAKLMKIYFLNFPSKKCLDGALAYLRKLTQMLWGMERLGKKIGMCPWENTRSDGLPNYSGRW